MKTYQRTFCGLMLLFAACVVSPATAYYNPAAGRWLSRDPIEEKGGPNVVAFLRNDPVNGADIDGRLSFDQSCLAWENDIRNAIATACDQINSIDFTCCMSPLDSLKGEAREKLKKVCLDREFTVKCEAIHPLGLESICAAAPDAQTMILYLGFFQIGARQNHALQLTKCYT